MHGGPSLDQLSPRPRCSLAGYRGPRPALYLCRARTSPGRRRHRGAGLERRSGDPQLPEL